MKRYAALFIFITIVFSSCSNPESKWMGISGPVKSIEIYSTSFTNGEEGEKQLGQKISFNKDGDQVKQITYVDNGNRSWESKSSYYKPGKIKKFQHFADGSLISESEYSYDTNGLQTAFETRSAEGEKFTFGKFKYNSSGTRIVKFTVYQLPGEEILSENFYDEGENIVKIIATPDVEDPTKRRETIFEYHSPGIFSKVTSTYGNKKGKGIQIFDSSGRMTVMEQYFDDETVYRTEIDYSEFDEHGNWTKSTQYVVNEEDDESLREVNKVVYLKIDYYK